MDNTEFFKSELKHTKGGYISAIIENDNAVNELFIEVQTTDKVPNLRLYCQNIKIELNNDENYTGIYSRDCEKRLNDAQNKFYENYKNIDKKYHYWNIEATPTIQNLMELKRLIDELEDTKVIENKFFDRKARFKLIEDLYLKLPTYTRKVVFDAISDFRIIRDAERFISASMDVKEKDVSSETELRISLVNHLSSLTVEENKFKGIAQDLGKYIEPATDEAIMSIIKYKTLPSDTKLHWIGETKNDAIVFCETADVKVSEWNKCFYFSDGKPLCDSNKTKNPYKKYEIKMILEKYLK